jgi:hypothetical protein
MDRGINADCHQDDDEAFKQRRTEKKGTDLHHDDDSLMTVS